jgi:uncharacterized repeat protein (TIGR03803 family)
MFFQTSSHHLPSSIQETNPGRVGLHGCKPFVRLASLALICGLGISRLDAQGFTALYTFTDGNDGARPFGALIQGTDGRLYGTTNEGGADGEGTIFAINLDGSAYTALYAFTGGNDGAAPKGGLIQGTDGRLYGTATGGGMDGDGTVFAVNTDGTGFTTLHSFTNGDGQGPWAGLVQGTDGRLYGTTINGGANGDGAIFAVNTDGTGFTTLHSFTRGSDGAFPEDELIQGTDGRLYGTALQGGGDGTVFAINTDGTGFTTLHSFTGGSGGAFPKAGLIQGADGRLYGSTYNGGTPGGFGAIFAINSDGSGFTTLYSFTGGADGANPDNALIQGADGKLYGTGQGGGTDGDGAVFAINTDGTGFATLYSFTGGNDGSNPYAALTEATNGDLYGGTINGGAGTWGTLFVYYANLPTPTPTPTPTSTPTPTPSPTPSPSPSPTPSPTPSATPSPTPSPTRVPTPTPRPSPTPEPSPTPGITPTPTPTRAPTPAPRPSPTPEPSPTPGITPTPTPTRVPTPTPRPSPAPRPSPTPTPA